MPGERVSAIISVALVAMSTHGDGCLDPDLPGPFNAATPFAALRPGRPCRRLTPS